MHTRTLTLTTPKVDTRAYLLLVISSSPGRRLASAQLYQQCGCGILVIGLSGKAVVAYLSSEIPACQLNTNAETPACCCLLVHSTPNDTQAPGTHNCDQNETLLG